MRKMDQLCSSGASDEPSVAGNETTMRADGDAPAAASGGCFDCNICLDFATEPVVTLCGHLYCWPCIYEWLRPDGGADESSSTTRPCPVCKAEVAPDALVPLYGRGGCSSSKKARHGTTIPRRPTLHREVAVERRSSHDGGHQQGDMGASPTAQAPRYGRHHARAVPAPAPAPSHAQFDVLYPPPAAGSTMSMFHSTAGGVALSVLPWMFRGHVPQPSAYDLNPYQMSPRLRRHHMEVERSLQQICFFLFVFVVLCLLLF